MYIHVYVYIYILVYTYAYVCVDIYTLYGSDCTHQPSLYQDQSHYIFLVPDQTPAGFRSKWTCVLGREMVERAGME